MSYTPAVLAACRGRFLTIRDIAEHLSRKPRTIRNFITNLVSKGRLELEDSERPTKPGQAYRTVEEGS